MPRSLFVNNWAETLPEQINVNDLYLMAEWARRLAEVRQENDVNDCLLRGVVGVYQLEDLFKQYGLKNYIKAEFSECVASLFLHTVSSVEMTDADFAGYIYDTHKYKRLTEYAYCDRRRLQSDYYCDIIRGSAAMLRQLLYFRMHRTKRFSQEKLLFSADKFLSGVFCMATRRQYDILLGLEICIGKLNDCEFKGH